MIDRNGNNVEKFPVKLPQHASNGITPLDYDKNRNYRLLIGCTDNRVYNYTTSGDLVNGWEYEATESPADKNIWHFAIKNKDYIVIPLKNGTIKVVERSGKDRIKLTNQLPQTSNSVSLTLNGELKSVHLTTVDTAGNVIKLYFNNTIENINFSGVNKNSLFEYVDINNDGRNDYIFTSNNMINVFDFEKNKLFETEIESDIITSPLFFRMPDKSTKIGLVTSSNIYLFNEAGTMNDDFPLSGSTPFNITDLNNDNTSNLVVADKDILYMYNLK